MKLDIAAGQNKTEGFVGVDIWEGSDIVHDLESFPWPFEDNSIDEIICNHYFEHCSDMMKFMNECFRILKPGAQLTITCPYYASMRCWQDPTHKNAISEASFLYYNKKWREDNKLDHYPIIADFDYSYAYNIPNPFWNMKSEEAKAFAIRHYINVVDDITAFLIKRK